ncbi:hypothetical protein BV898_18072 [Hypsibius exemplaris]|uniref:Uncharacterized protein n=1 Tax=Hypsibius exemplaris TaxID=2072580 RepID=A0A9X6NNF1_HYPEX|nr:hypothetical protein BV898_18072 [Hypsibius exemplaris]
MMAPTTPQDFLIKSGKAIDMEIRVQKKPHSSRVEILPNAIIDPVSLHEKTVAAHSKMDRSFKDIGTGSSMRINRAETSGNADPGTITNRAEANHNRFHAETWGATGAAKSPSLLQLWGTAF